MSALGKRGRFPLAVSSMSGCSRRLTVKRRLRPMSGYSFVLFLHSFQGLSCSLVVLWRGQFLLVFGRLSLLTYRGTSPFWLQSRCSSNCGRGDMGDVFRLEKQLTSKDSGWACVLNRPTVGDLRASKETTGRRESGLRWFNSWAARLPICLLPRNWTAGVVVPGLYGLVRFLMPWVYYLVEAYPHAKARLSTAPPLFFSSPGVHMYHI